MMRVVMVVAIMAALIMMVMIMPMTAMRAVDMDFMRGAKHGGRFAAASAQRQGGRALEQGFDAFQFICHEHISGMAPF